MNTNQLSSGLSFEMPSGKLFSNETAPADTVEIPPPYQLPILAPESLGKKPITKKFLSALFG